MLWLCWDDSGCRLEIEADSLTEAAQEYVSGGDYHDEGRTYWVRVYGVPFGGDEDDRPESVKVEVSPPEPRCTGPAHDWQAPHDVVGGLVENPGVFGHGGGVMVHEVCAHCGVWRITDTWAQDRADGEQGLRSVRYERL